MILLTVSHYGFSLNTKKLRQNIKTTFLSWYTGSEKITFERAIGEHFSSEFTAGIIGIINDSFNNEPNGYTFRYAQKYIFSNNKTFALNGPYAKAELVYSDFKYNNQIKLERERSQMGALFGMAGYQWAKHALTFDFCVGAGGAVGNPTDVLYQHGFILWNMFNHYYRHLALTFEMKIGCSF